MNMLVSGAALTASSPVLPALADALDASPNQALQLWHERQRHVEALRPLVSAYNEASERMPDWAKPGHRYLDHEGRLCGEEWNWPLDPTVTPPTHEGVYREVRPSIYGVKRDFESFMRQCGNPSSSFRASARKKMRQRIRAIVARLREKERIEEELGLTALSDEIETLCQLIGNAEWALEDLDPSPDTFAARLMAQLSQDCSRDAVASGNGYCTTAAMALTALEALLPALSPGLIRDHATFFVENRTAPFSAMPFSAA